MGRKNTRSDNVDNGCCTLMVPANGQSLCHLTANIYNISVNTHMKWEGSSFFSSSTGAHPTYPCTLYLLGTNGLVYRHNIYLLLYLNLLSVKTNLLFQLPPGWQPFPSAWACPLSSTGLLPRFSWARPFIPGPL